MCAAVSSHTASTQQCLNQVSVVVWDFVPVMQASFLHGTTHACVLIHILGIIVKNLTAVTQAETPVRMVRLVETLQMVLLIVLFVLACLVILGIYVT